VDTRYKFKEVRQFISNLYKNYTSDIGPSKHEKRQSYFRTLRLLLMYLWNGISAPFIYPVWYLFRKQICAKIYKGTSWNVINQMVENNRRKEVKSILKANGKFWYWLWTYGDLRDPLGEGEIVNYGVKNNIWNRYKENAFRNARFTINFMEFNTSDIVEIVTVIDTRNINYKHKSWGLGDQPDGIYFVWMKDIDNNWHYNYSDINKNNFFYCGYVGLGSFGRKYTRFEISYRATDSSYNNN